MQWTPQNQGTFVAAQSAPAASPTDGTMIFDALKDQLGLELKLVDAPIQNVTILHIEEPAAN